MDKGKVFIDSLSNEERDPSGPWKKVGSEIQPLFEDITKDIQTLKNLYEQSRTKEWDNEFVPANLFCKAPVLIEKDLLEGRDIDLKDCLVANACIFIISPMGRGKTTYLHYTLKIDLPKRFGRFRLIPIIFDVLDCDKPSSFPMLLAQKIDIEIDKAFPFFSVRSDEEMETTTHKALCEAFSEDLRKAGLPGRPILKTENPIAHQQQRDCLGLLRQKDIIGFSATRLDYARKKDPQAFILLAIDNMDQGLMFPNGEEIILASFATARRLSCPLIMTLRDTSFRKNNPAFITASFSPRYLVLSSALSLPMLRKRLKEAHSLVKEDSNTARFIQALVSQLGVENQASVNRISTLVSEWIEPISNRSRREMLDVMRSVISSLHLTAHTFERSRPSKNDYVNTDFEIPVARVKMAILLGRHPYYADDSSSICALNLFCIDQPHIVNQHLIRLKLLQYLSLHREEGIYIHELIDKCVSPLGESYRSILKSVIARFLEKGLAVAYDERDDFQTILIRTPIDMDKLLNRRLHISLNGIFHHDVLLKDDIYLDEMKYVTPLPNNTYSDVFRDYTEGWPKSRHLRQESTTNFINYLVSCEHNNITKKFSDVLGVGPILKSSLEAYEKVIRAMDEHDTRKILGNKR